MNNLDKALEPKSNKNYIDKANFACGNGGYITFGISKTLPSAGDAKINISRWSISFIDTVVPINGSGQGSKTYYTTICTTAKIRVELNWDHIQRNEYVWGSITRGSPGGKYPVDDQTLFNINSNIFSFKGILADKNQTEQEKGWVCSEVVITDVFVVSSQEQDDVIKVIIEGVARAGVLIYPEPATSSIPQG